MVKSVLCWQRMGTKTQLEESEVIRMMEERKKDGGRSFFEYPFRATGHSTRPPAPSWWIDE